MNACSEERVKLRSLLLTALVRAVDRQQRAAVEVEPPAQEHELAETPRNAARL
jgi:hypothetical protein